MWYEGAVKFALSLLSFQSGLTSLCFVDDLCQILGMFSLNSIGCNVIPYILGNTTDRCMYINVLKSSYRKIWSNILTG